jgi:hypothetical protein
MSPISIIKPVVLELYMDMATHYVDSSDHSQRRPSKRESAIEVLPDLTSKILATLLV